MSRTSLPKSRRVQCVTYHAPKDCDLLVHRDARCEIDALLTLSSHVVIDLTAVKFIDASGLGLFLWARQQARSRGGDVALMGTNVHVRWLLELTQLDHVFPIHDHPEDLDWCAIRVRAIDTVARSPLGHPRPYMATESDPSHSARVDSDDPTPDPRFDG